MDQPLTARQLSLRTGLHRDVCSYLLWELSVYRLVHCLNPQARRGRLYGLTSRGARIARRLSPTSVFDVAKELDWSLYGRLCFSQRSSVVRALHCPMQPAEIKRRIRMQNERARISANNVRDIVRELRAWDIVRPVRIAGRLHARYQLTPQGTACRELLLRAEGPR